MPSQRFPSRDLTHLQKQVSLGQMKALSTPPVRSFIVIAGPCVIESADLLEEIAESLRDELLGLPIEFYFKASFDKANRSSGQGFRGPGLEQGLLMLEAIKKRFGFALLTDFHTPEQAFPVAEVVDFLQVPAFLCRQTDLILAAAEAALKKGKRLNVKKGQFLAPWDAKNIVDKVESVVQQAHQVGVYPSRADWLCLTERGVSFGYNTLVVDMISFPCLQNLGYPVIYDATHSVQKPGAAGKETGGQREYLEVLARAAVAAGADGIFLECHPRPSVAKSDASTAFPLAQVGPWLRQLLALRATVQNLPWVLEESQQVCLTKKEKSC